MRLFAPDSQSRWWLHVAIVFGAIYALRIFVLPESWPPAGVIAAQIGLGTAVLALLDVAEWWRR